MRYVVVGTSGAGKSTFAQALAKQRNLSYVELDSLFWGPDWTPVDPAEFARRVATATRADVWVADGNYSAVRPALWGRATDIIWLNFGRVTVFSRILRRTIYRSTTGEALWAGNKDSLRKAFFSRESILLWSVTTYTKNRVKYRSLQQHPEFSHLRWHELRSPSEAKEFLRTHSTKTDKVSA